MTDMPEKIYIETIYNNTPCGCSIEKTEEETGVSQTEYTLSSLCVPRSEYDKLKQQADRLADAAEKALWVRPAGICKNKTVFEIETILKHALAEYRKEI